MEGTITIINNVRCEIEVAEHGFFLTVALTDTNADAELDAFLLENGWCLLNNGVTMDSEPNVIGAYYFKPRSI